MPRLADSRALTTALNLFLSSTVRDLKAYRREIRDACRQKADTACFLSEEDWSAGYDDTVAKCEERVRSSDAFLLIVAHFYGSVPPGKDRSITHLEFDCALKKWGTLKFPPMAVMLPEPGTAIDKALRKTAQTLLDQDRVDAVLHGKSIEAFRTTITGSWRTVTRFKSRADLREWAIANCKDWRGHSPMAAASGQVPGANDLATLPQVSDEQLGAIGREPQIQATKKVLTRLADYPDVPAIAFVVCGDEFAGQRAGALRLMKVALRNYAVRTRLTRLPASAPSAAALSSWLAQSIGIPNASDVQTPEQLAARVANELKRQTLCFALDRVGDVPGGIAGFHTGLWLPFYRELSKLRAAQQFPNRLVALITDYSGDVPVPETTTATADPRGVMADYERLVRLPPLEQFDRDAILAWFDEMDIPDAPAGRRAALADRALRGSGGADPNPILVFERLRGETLWPETAGGNE